MKQINVVGAIIEKEDMILIAQRKKGDLAGLWEFPGGKVEEDESKQDALKREIKEELNVEIVVNKFLVTAHYDYPTFHLHMDCYMCTLKNEQDHLHLNDHLAIKWVPKDVDINAIQWVPADVQVITCLQQHITKS